MAKQYKTLLVDDEFLALELLANFVGRVPDLEIVGRLDSAVKAIDFLAQNPVDILMLDIQMPHLSGTSLLSVLKNPPVTIFTTAYADHAVEAFALDATDYLLKPFSFERFLQAIGKARDSLQKAQAPTVDSDVIAFRADGQLHRLPVSNILFVEGMKEYVRITTPQRRYTAFARLHQIEAMLPTATFLKVHRSYTVAVAQVQALEGNRLQVHGYKVPVSRDLKAAAIARLFPQG